ncbi:MAG TPA: Ig domain-containing protein [Arenimonas sp.]|uniref:Ig domain-containing protein n=1 Tax=Arenimonas sp. TaxID=1872635 RepID=UPI002D8051E4|nr:Ig domain-containing protein [Arenimonas sp.]HEU0152880.1 Ig domain-containing protein [Arenimonas sp.]
MSHRTLARLLAALALSLAGTAAAVDQPSTYPGCATRSVTVPWGGSVEVDLKTCHSFGLGAVSQPPRHGTATPGANVPVDGYRYTHGGGAPAGGGRDQFVVLDDNSDTITVSVSIQAPASALAITPAALPALRTGQAARVGLAAGGGRAPYTFRLASGGLPAGLALAADGALSGVPTSRASFAFEVEVRDAAGASTRRSFAGVVLPGAISITPAGAEATRGQPFRQVLAARGGVPPHHFRLEGAGRLPKGLVLSPEGVISGTPVDPPGRYPLTLRVTDRSGGDGDYFEIEAFELRVLAPPAPAGAGGG